jgi:hypothetical protein
MFFQILSGAVPHLPITKSRRWPTLKFSRISIFQYMVWHDSPDQTFCVYGFEPLRSMASRSPLSHNRAKISQKILNVSKKGDVFYRLEILSLFKPDPIIPIEFPIKFSQLPRTWPMELWTYKCPVKVISKILSPERYKLFFTLVKKKMSMYFVCIVLLLWKCGENVIRNWKSGKRNNFNVHIL